MNRNEYEEFTEKDWKLFRSKIALWQENYMARLNKEYIRILTQDKNASEKFWEVEKRIKSDKRKPGVLIEMKRSRMISNILELLQDETIVMDDLDEFSDTFKETIRGYINSWGNTKGCK